MSTVTLNIGPKTYTIACADGEEAHIESLGAMIAEKYALLGASRAPLEAQNLLFAALFLADELAEARKRDVPPPAATGEKTLKSDLVASLDEADETSDAIAEQLEALASRIEASAAALEAEAASA